MSWEDLVTGYTDGPTLTAAARASCIPTAHRLVLPNNFFYPGRRMKLTLAGRISCAAVTPGTARFDVCMGAAGTTIVYDTLAFNLNVNGKTTVDYTEPDPVVRKKGREGRVVSSGTFALQGHDPKSKVWIKNIRVKVLP